MRLLRHTHMSGSALAFLRWNSRTKYILEFIYYRQGNVHFALEFPLSLVNVVKIHFARYTQSCARVQGRFKKYIYFLVRDRTIEVSKTSPLSQS